MRFCARSSIPNGWRASAARMLMSIKGVSAGGVIRISGKADRAGFLPDVIFIDLHVVD